jgi:hypothetical protein
VGGRLPALPVPLQYQVPVKLSPHLFLETFSMRDIDFVVRVSGVVAPHVRECRHGSVLVNEHGAIPVIIAVRKFPQNRPGTPVAWF